MPRLLIDEDLPRSLTRQLRAAGFDVEDVRSVGLRGHSDDEVFAHAVATGRVLLTADMGFSNILRFPLGSHAGIAVARFPAEMTVANLVVAVVQAIQQVRDDEFPGSLVILEPGRIRLRRRP